MIIRPKSKPNYLGEQYIVQQHDGSNITFVSRTYSIKSKNMQLHWSRLD